MRFTNIKEFYIKRLLYKNYLHLKKPSKIIKVSTDLKEKDQIQSVVFKCAMKAK